MLLIDSYYFYLESRKYGPKGIDISKLLAYLKASGYKPKHKKWITSLNDDSSRNFYNWLKSYSGPQMEIVIKGTKQKHFKCFQCGYDHTITVEKGNDTQIATYIVHGALTNLYETLILVSGDGDFEPAVKVAKEAGKKIVLVGNKETVSTDLQYLADNFIVLNDISGLEKD